LFGHFFRIFGKRVRSPISPPSRTPPFSKCHAITNTFFRPPLRRAIESIHCLFTGLGRLRIAAVRVQFRGRNRHRTSYTGYEPGRSNHRVKREGRYEVFTDTDNAAPDLPHGDLRHPGEVATVEPWLHGLADAINTPCENAQRIPSAWSGNSRCGDAVRAHQSGTV
jgi:hypothetical protein